MKGRRARLLLLAFALAALACGDPGGGAGEWEECRGDDSDGDGVADTVESALGTDPADPADNPDARGMIVFVMPYEAPPEPTSRDLSLDVHLSRADVAILLDTTGSMAGTVVRIGGHLEPPTSPSAPPATATSRWTTTPTPTPTSPSTWSTAS